MELELPSQGTALHIWLQAFGMLKLGKVTFGLGLKQCRIPNNCLDKKADIMITKLKIKDIL